MIIESGKRREKKKVERLSMQEVVPKESRKFEVGEGSGDKLGDCARSKTNSAGLCVEIDFPRFSSFFFVIKMEN